MSVPSTASSGNTALTLGFTTIPELAQWLEQNAVEHGLMEGNREETADDQG